MKAEIIMIGTELLLGQIVDTNAAYLARQLAALGIDVYRKTTVGDNEQRIAKAVRKALSRCDVVITSGGIGPTVDDKTRSAVAAATDQTLILNSDLLAFIAEFFEKRGYELGENNKRQAYIPQNAIPIENPVGTAPAFIVERDGACSISLPGVPRELYYLFEHAVTPYLVKKFDIRTIIKIRVLRTAGLGESTIDRMIADLEESTNPTVGLAAHPGSVDIRISAKADNEKTAADMLDKMEKKIRDRVGDAIYGIDTDTIEQVVVEMLRKRGLTLSLIETNTGGLFVSRLTEVHNGFHVMNRAYTLSIRQAVEFLPANIDPGSRPSEALAVQLANGVRSQSQTAVGVAIVGDEDPDVGPFEKNTGSTCIAVSSESSTESRRIPTGGISNDARVRITNFAFEVLREYLVKKGH